MRGMSTAESLRSRKLFFRLALAIERKDYTTFETNVVKTTDIDLQRIFRYATDTGAVYATMICEQEIAKRNLHFASGEERFDL